MTTIHSYTATQKTVDGPSQEGLEGRPRGGDQHHPVHHRRRQGRRAGAARDEGQAHRHGVPRADARRLGRRPDLQDGQGDQRSRRSTACMKKASETYLKGILGYTDDEVVSTDFIHDDRSSIYDRRRRCRSS